MAFIRGQLLLEGGCYSRKYGIHYQLYIILSSTIYILQLKIIYLYLSLVFEVGIAMDAYEGDCEFFCTYP